MTKYIQSTLNKRYYDDIYSDKTYIFVSYKCNMVKKTGCDMCNKDFNEGTGADLKIKVHTSGLWKIADVCGTCLTEKVLPLVVTLKYKRYDKESKRFIEAV